MGLTVVCKLEQAAIVGILRKALDIFYAFSFQILLFAVRKVTTVLPHYLSHNSFQIMPDMFSIIGAVLIALVVLSSGAKKVLDGLPNDHKLKTKYLSRCYAGEEISSA